MINFASDTAASTLSLESGVRGTAPDGSCADAIGLSELNLWSTADVNDGDDDDGDSADGDVLSTTCARDTVTDVASGRGGDMRIRMCGGDGRVSNKLWASQTTSTM
jgi:hypothetical protein